MPYFPLQCHIGGAVIVVAVRWEVLAEMSIQRIHRLLRLIMLLQSGRAKSSYDVTHELGVSRRTLFRDLKALEAAGVPYYHERGVGYRVARSFFLPPISLTVLETLALMLLGQTAAAQRGRPMHGPAMSALCKLIATAPEPIRSACSELMANVSVDPGPQAIAELEDALYRQLQRCIDEGRVCKMVYRSRLEDEPEPLDCNLEPYALHFAARAWYVMGRSDIHDEVRTFKLARIASLEPLKRRFDRPKRFRAADRIGRAWQLIPEGKIYRVELDFSSKVAVNVSEVRWHASQQSRMLPDGRCRITFEVDGIGEIAWWLCGYADQVNIRKPAELRSRVRKMLEAAVERHAAQDSL